MTRPPSGTPRLIPKREPVFAVLPTLLTLGNGFCGFAAITSAARIGPDVEAAGGHLLTASMYLFLGMFFDMLDGRVARWTKQTSDFGAQLDSLCDAISFGVAPAFMMLQFSRSYHPRVIWAIAVLFVLCALLRLARFNSEATDEHSDTFSGLPTPAAAGVVASFHIAMFGLPKLFRPVNPEITRFERISGQLLQTIGVDLLPLLVFCLACLMVSRIPYAHVFDQLFSGRRSRAHLLRVVFATAVLVMIREMALFAVFTIYAFFPPLRAAWQKWIAPKLAATAGPDVQSRPEESLDEDSDDPPARLYRH